MIHNIEAIKTALQEQGIEIDSRFERAFRKLSNPGGCELCGANTKVGVEDPKKKFLKTACCGVKIGN